MDSTTISAFPYGSAEEGGEPGMNLLDYFAIRVLQSLMSQSHGDGEIEHGNMDPMIKRAYAIARKMQKERERLLMQP